MLRRAANIRRRRAVPYDKITVSALPCEVLLMPFEKVETQVDFPARERAVLEFWQRTRHLREARGRRTRGKPRWSFLDGPITANNPMGVHHAWGRTYKDAYQRYFAMTGHELRYQNGFDCQGLWVEVEVEKELKLNSKRDIENLVPGDRFASIDHFVTLCKDRVDTLRPPADRAIDPPGLLDGLGSRRRLEEAAR